MSNKNSLKRRCRACSKRVRLKIIWIDGIKMIECPNCLVKCRFTNQEKYEARKKIINSKVTI